MKVLKITCKSSDEDDEFKTELDIIIDELSQGRESGFDICKNPDGHYYYSIEYTDT